MHKQSEERACVQHKLAVKPMVALSRERSNRTRFKLTSLTFPFDTTGSSSTSKMTGDVTEAAKRAGGVARGGVCLLVIDQQVDFHPGGSLAIPTANEDAARIAAFIGRHRAQLAQLVFTLDSHQRYHIAHGVFWENERGESPAPFTLISSQDVAAGVWKPRDPQLREYVLAYTQSLEKSGKFTLCIWPEHCVIGTPGHNLVEDVRTAALEWTKHSLKQIQYVMKGSNSFTEHYSALRAEFELPYDPATRCVSVLAICMGWMAWMRRRRDEQH